MVLGRSDHADLAKRKLEMSTEMMWAPSESFGTKKQILTQVRPDGNYQPPQGFCFDFNACDCDPIMDIEALEDYNVDERVDAFVDQAQQYSDVIRGNDILFLMGSDFQWENANIWYKNLDKLIHYVNKDGRVNVFYSTPENYFDQKRASNISFPVKTDDFFPYSDFWHAYWGGYFTSRPSQKHYVFRMQALLQSARQVEYFMGSSLKDSDALDKLDDAVGVLMHHDAITGTARQAVADDYAKRLYEGSVQATDLLNHGFKEMIKRFRETKDQIQVSEDKTHPILPLESPLKLKTGEKGEKSLDSSSSPPLLDDSDGDFVQCRLLNTSVCAFTETSSRTGTNMQVVVYNNLAQVREDHVHLPIGKGNASVAVFDGAWKSVASQITPLGHDREVEDLAFAVKVPPKGFAIYYVMFKNIPKTGSLAQRATLRQVTQNETSANISGENVVVSFDGLSGYMSHYQNKKNGISKRASIEFLVYNSSAGNGQNSGAYIFRPAGTLPILNKNLSLTLVEGPVFSEMRQDFASWLSLSTRLYSSDSWLKLLWKAGSIPISDHFGKEISMRISSGVKSGDEFYTDSNGREMLKRIVDYRPTWDLDVSEPVAGNYYPLTAALAIKDDTSEMSVLLDRACGGTSLNGGDLEFMIHRRVLQDDARGVGEPLNETDCGCINCNCAGLHIVGSNYLVLDEIEAATQARRNLQQKQQDPLVVAFRANDGMEREIIPPMSGLGDGGLPENINLMTFHALNSSSVLIRLAHMYQAHESSTLSKDAEVDLSTLFPGKKVERVSEMSLSANQELSTDDGGSSYSVTVAPMEIKTYIVTSGPKAKESSGSESSSKGLLAKLAEPFAKLF
jgi:alpha-mannosidase